MRKKRVLFATNYNANDTTSYLRAWGPFTLMRDEVEIVEPLIDWQDKNGQWWKNWRNWFNNIDVCFMHRPYGAMAASIMAECKLAGVPLWVDHDDDLLAIPDKNPHAKIHKESEKQFPSIEYSYKYADVLTCSGEVMHKQLKEKYGRADAIHITSGIDDRLVRFKKPFTNNKKVGWRGSKSHKSDLEEFQTGIRSIIHRNSDRNFYFWGINPQDLWPEFVNYPNWRYEEQLNFLQYIQSITKENCAIHWVVLEDNHFNRVKSNLAWLDCTLAGSACIGPDFPEFNRPGIIRYRNIDEFKRCMDGILCWDSEILSVNHNESWSYIQDCLLTSHLNKQRREILRNL